MREFAKYNGDVQACLKGIQREKLGGEVEAIDRTTRKRKWVESQETESPAKPTHEFTRGTKSGACGRHLSRTNSELLFYLQRK